MRSVSNNAIKKLYSSQEPCGLCRYNPLWLKPLHVLTCQTAGEHQRYWWKGITDDLPLWMWTVVLLSDLRKAKAFPAYLMKINEKNKSWCWGHHLKFMFQCLSLALTCRLGFPTHAQQGNKSKCQWKKLWTIFICKQHVNVLQSPANHLVHLFWRLRSGPGAPGTGWTPAREEDRQRGRFLRSTCSCLSCSPLGTTGNLLQ